MRTCVVKSVIRSVQGICLDRELLQILYSFQDSPVFIHARATCSELPFIKSNSMVHNLYIC